MSSRETTESITISFDISLYDATPEENDQALLSQQTQKYVISKKEVYTAVLEYLESSECIDEYLDNLIKIIDAQKFEKNQEEYEHFLYMIEHISNNHHRDEIFINKIFQILQYYKQQIKQTLSNVQIFNIFQNNKKILLFLIENEIIKVDKCIAHKILTKSKNNGNGYGYFFYPEIKKFLTQKKIKEIKSKNDNIFDNFDENRHKGENDSYICTLIRQDSVEDFIIYVNRTNIDLKSEIVPSIFETNSFLLGKNPTLIEYAAFFGSIQIFRYLMMNNVELTPSIWLYIIHSKNAELIHLLESHNVPPPKSKRNEKEEKGEDNSINSYIQCLIESIKCHHNDISEYFKNNLIEFDKINSKEYENTISSILCYHNYFNFPTEFDKDDEFYYLCKYNYNELAKLFVKKKKAFIIELIKKNKGAIEISKNTNYNILILYYSMLKQKKIDTKIYKNNCVIEKIAIPPSIKSINDESFSGCSSLEQITIPSSVASIGSYAFSECSSLAQIAIPSSVASIGSYAFSECSSLAQITIPSSVTSIGDSAFKKCSSLKQITFTFSSPVTSIRNGTFFECSSLTQITIPSSVTEIECFAFFRCSSLTQITIPSSVKKIGIEAFRECSSLTQITIPSSVTEIYAYAFAGCSSLTQITIPSSVTEIGYGYFFRCSSLTQVTIPSSVKKIGPYAFSECSSLTQITIPSSVTEIECFAFFRCSSLTQITIPSSIDLHNIPKVNITTY